MKTNQEIFDIVSKHLLTQNKRSLGPQGNCAYRGEDGLQCAAGCLIPDEIYDPRMEGAIWDLRCDMFPELIKIGDPSFIGMLQSIHDCDGVKLWKYDLKKIAKQYKLTCNF